jgi:hypothetical protein
MLLDFEIVNANFYGGEKQQGAPIWNFTKMRPMAFELWDDTARISKKLYSA